jgi:hypothetical protein
MTASVADARIGLESVKKSYQVASGRSQAISRQASPLPTVTRPEHFI